MQLKKLEMSWKEPMAYLLFTLIWVQNKVLFKGYSHFSTFRSSSKNHESSKSLTEIVLTNIFNYHICKS